MSDTQPEPARDPVVTCRDWHARLEHHSGDRAALRRADSTTAALLVPATHWLCAELGTHGFRTERAAALAILLARCEGLDEKRPIAEAMALGDPPAVSALRFRRLLASEGLDELLTQLRRAIALLHRKVHLPSLVEALRWWHFDAASANEARVVRDWACAYFAKQPSSK